MAFATKANVGLRYIEEVTLGVTPGTPAMVALPVTNSSIVMKKNSFVSEEKRPDRQVGALRTGSQFAEGAFDFEPRAGDFDPFLESLFGSAFSTDVLKVGNTIKSFSLETAFPDIGQYEVARGCRMSSLSLSVKPDAMATASFGVVGVAVDAMTGTPLDASPTDTTGNDPFDGLTGTFQEGGSSIGILTGIDLTIDQGIEPAFVLGSSSAQQVDHGTFDVKGTITAFLENAALANKFVNETLSSLRFTLSDGVNSHEFYLPRIKYSNADRDVAGKTGNVILTMPFQAIYDQTEGSTVVITRA